MRSEVVQGSVSCREDFNPEPPVKRARPKLRCLESFVDPLVDPVGVVFGWLLVDPEQFRELLGQPDTG